jgi:hypothetical protein
LDEYKKLLTLFEIDWDEQYILKTGKAPTRRSAGTLNRYYLCFYQRVVPLEQGFCPQPFEIRISPNLKKRLPAVFVKIRNNI